MPAITTSHPRSTPALELQLTDPPADCSQNVCVCGKAFWHTVNCDTENKQKRRQNHRANSDRNNAKRTHLTCFYCLFCSFTGDKGSVGNAMLSGSAAFVCSDSRFPQCGWETTRKHSYFWEYAVSGNTESHSNTNQRTAPVCDLSKRDFFFTNPKNFPHLYVGSMPGWFLPHSADK